MHPARLQTLRVTAAAMGRDASKDTISFLFHEKEPAMVPYPEVPDLPEQYLEV